MSRLVGVRWLHHGLVVLTGLALAVSCKKDGTGPAADYTLSLAPAALTIVQGATGTTTVTINRMHFNGGVPLSLGGAPAGITGSFNPPAPTGTTSTLTVSVGAAVAPGVYNLTVAGAGSAGNRSTPLTLTVSAAPPPPDYSLSLAPAALTIVQGATGTSAVTITRTNFTGAVTLSLGNAPTGVSGSFDPAAPAGTSSTLTVSVGAAVVPGVYNLTVNGTGTAGNRSTPLTLTVSAAPDYSLSLSPASLTIEQGANGSITVTITRTNFTGAVTLSLGNTPTGVSGSFNPVAPTGTSSTLTLSVGAAVAPGVYNLTVDGTGAPGGRSTPLTLTVTAAPNYTLSLAPTALTIVQGETSEAAVTITRTNFTGAVTLSLGNAPTGVTGSFDPAAPTGTSSTLTVTVGATVAPGVYNLTVNGTGAPGNRSTPLTLTVSAAPAITLAPTSVTFNATVGGANPAMQDVAVTNGGGGTLSALTASVSYTAGQTTGWLTATLSTTTAPSTLTLTAATGTLAAGTYTADVVVASPVASNSPQTVSVTFTVSEAPTYTLVLTPQDLTIGQGASGTTTVQITRTDFTGAVTLTLEDAPAGVSGVFDPTPASGTASQLTLSVGAAVVPGRYDFTVRGTATGFADRTATLTLFVSAVATRLLINGQTHSGTIAAPGELHTWTFTAAQGEVIALSIGEVAPASDFRPWIRLVSPSNALIGNGFSPNEIGLGAGQITVTAPASGTYTVIVTSADFGNDATGSYLLTLAKAPGTFEISAGDEGGGLTAGVDHPGTIYVGDLDPWIFTATQGQVVTVNISEVDPASDFRPWIRLVSPTGALIGNAFAPNETGLGTAQIAVTAPASGTYTVVVTTADFGNDATGSYLLRVNHGAASSDYTLSVDPTALTIVQGATGSATVTITRTNFTGAVTLSLGNVAAGISGSFDPAAPTGTSSTLTVNVAATVAPGVYDLTVDGAATTGSRSTSLTLTVSAAGDYALSLTPTQLTIEQGATGTTTVTITRTNFSDPVSLSLGNAPPGVTGSFDPTAPTGTSSTLTVTVGAAAAPGVYNLTVDGAGAPGDRSTPLTLTVIAPSPGDVTVVTAGNHSCALNTAGEAFCWGSNNAGQLGDGTTTDRLIPTPVSGGLTFSALSAGETHTCGVTTSGAAYCWGYNGDGQLGDGESNDRLVPTLVAGNLTFAAVSASAFHTCGVTTSGAAYCWGNNAAGALGDGTTDSYAIPTLVAGNLTFASVSAGRYHTCGVTTSNAAYCWGANYGGEVGDGTTAMRLVPTTVAGDLLFASISAGRGGAGGGHTCGVTTSGAAYCWGNNNYGQLGDGTQNPRLVPTQVAGSLAFVAVSATTMSHTCGLTGDGLGYCWGRNDAGQLGDGTTETRFVPTALAGQYSTVSAGLFHTCAVSSSGAAYCWGSNNTGQLGDGTSTNRPIPTPVVFP